MTEVYKARGYKYYRVPVIGDIIPYRFVWAPNKTIARMIVNGGTNPNVKVKGKIVEIDYKDRKLFGDI